MSRARPSAIARLSGLFLVVLVSLSQPTIAANCAPVNSNITSPAAVGTIELSVGSAGGAETCSQCVIDAANDWNASCGDGIPSFTTVSGVTGAMQVGVAFYDNNTGLIEGCSSSKCGCRTLDVTNGEITSATIYLFHNAGTTSCDGSLTNVMRHELGHVLGLDDALACDTLMGTNLSAPVTSTECSSASANFDTPTDSCCTYDHPCKNPRK